jgi:hypothetical protein
MKKTIFLFSLMILISTVGAQEPESTNWKSSGNFSLNFSQSHLSNWAAGGESSITGISKLLYEINFDNEKTKFKNSIDLALGYSVLGEYDPIKTDDKIELNSMYGIKASENLFYTTTFSFKSQFMDGFDYKTDSTNPISRHFAPAYFTLGLGMDWSPGKFFQLNFAPLTGRITIVADKELADKGVYGLEPGENMRFEFGGKMIARTDIDLMKNVNFTAKLELFSDYLKNPQNIDIDLQALLTMKINDWLNANIAAHLIYDDDIMITDKDGKIGPRTQFKEVFSLGLAYKF